MMASPFDQWLQFQLQSIHVATELRYNSSISTCWSAWEGYIMSASVHLLRMLWRLRLPDSRQHPFEDFLPIAPASTEQPMAMSLQKRPQRRVYGLCMSGKMERRGLRQPIAVGSIDGTHCIVYAWYCPCLYDLLNWRLTNDDTAKVRQRIHARGRLRF